MSNEFQKLGDQQVEEICGGIIVEEGDGEKYWVVRQDGTVIAPAPSKEKAVEYAQAYHIITKIMTKEEYFNHFGRELAW